MGDLSPVSAAFDSFVQLINHYEPETENSISGVEKARHEPYQNGPVIVKEPLDHLLHMQITSGLRIGFVTFRSTQQGEQTRPLSEAPLVRRIYTEGNLARDEKPFPFYVRLKRGDEKPSSEGVTEAVGVFGNLLYVDAADAEVLKGFVVENFFLSGVMLDNGTYPLAMPPLGSNAIILGARLCSGGIVF